MRFGMLAQGYIRFSFLGRGDTTISKTLEQDSVTAAARLFDPLRMERRFHLFETLCLPGIEQQTDPSFHIAVLASNSMPDLYKARLERVISHLPQVRVHYSGASDVKIAARNAMKAIVDGHQKNSIHFRLDDDDPIAKDYIANLKAHAAYAAPGSIITQPRGCMLFAHGGRSYIEPYYKPFHSVGWARVNEPGDLRPPFRFGHFRARTRFVSVCDPRPLSHAYVMHGESDTAGANAKLIQNLVKARLGGCEEKNVKEFASQVDEAFPAIGSKGLHNAIMTVPNTVRSPEAGTELQRSRP